MFDAISKGEYHPSIEDIIYLSDFGGCNTFKPKKNVFSSLWNVYLVWIYFEQQLYRLGIVLIFLFLSAQLLWWDFTIAVETGSRQCRGSIGGGRLLPILAFPHQCFPPPTPQAPALGWPPGQAGTLGQVLGPAPPLRPPWGHLHPPAFSQLSSVASVDLWAGRRPAASRDWRHFDTSQLSWGVFSSPVRVCGGKPSLRDWQRLD